MALGKRLYLNAHICAILREDNTAAFCVDDSRVLCGGGGSGAARFDTPLYHLPASQAQREQDSKQVQDPELKAYEDATASVHVCLEAAWMYGEDVVVFSGRANGVVVAVSSLGPGDSKRTLWWADPTNSPVTAIKGAESTTEVFVAWKNGALSALNASNGQAKWEVRASSTSPSISVIALSDGELYASREDGSIVAYDPKTGVSLRQVNTTHEASVVSMHCERPYLASGDASGILHLTHIGNHVSDKFEVGTWATQKSLFKLVPESDFRSFVGPRVCHLVWATSEKVSLTDGLTSLERWCSEGHVGNILCLDANSRFVATGDSMGSI